MTATSQFISLNEAKNIADSPAGRDQKTLLAAFSRLAGTRMNSRSAAATAILNRRLDALKAEYEKRPAALTGEI
jgi:hypothetical protein